MGQVGLEPTTSRLKAEYSTIELLTRYALFYHHIQKMDIYFFID